MGTTKRSFPYEKICEGIKMIYKNKFGEVDILNKKYDFNNKIIGLSMSGGADRSMLCYLLAKTIQEEKLNIIIQPYNGYDIDVSGDSEKLPNIIEYIRNKFPDVEIRWPIAAVFKSNYKDIKNNYIGILRKKLEKYKVYDIRIIAISQGPPLEAQTKFKSKCGRNIMRLKGHYLYDEVNDIDDKNAPFKYIDKRFMIQCYKDFEMMDVLNEMTESCTELDKCKSEKCWWCLEREWAMKEVND